MSEQKHTPEWIKQLNAYGYPNYLGETHNAFNEGAMAVLKYIGLENVENPAEWVENMKSSTPYIQLAEAWEMGSVDARNKQMFQYSQGLDQDNPFRDNFDWDAHENSKMNLIAENERLKDELAKLKEDCLIIKTDSTLGEFTNEVIRMNGLYQNNKFTSAEALKNQLCEGLDNIMQTRLDEIKD